MITLCMIVKNEARGIVRTLESVRDYVDSWCIVDTGSTDGTQDLVRATMAGVPGQLHELPFVDFSTTRNDCLGLAGKCWRFMISADAVVENADFLAYAVAAADYQGASAVRVRETFGSLEFPKLSLTRSERNCFYGGVTHEAMCVPADAKVIDGPAALLVRYDGTDEDRTARWQLDVALLETELSKNRGQPRELFYLAQSYECLGDNAKAAELYAERITYDGNEDEAFIAQLRLGRCLWRLNRHPSEVIPALKAAIAMCPERAEPQFELAKYYHWLDMPQSSYDRAAIAARMPKPEGLFVERDVYEWRALDQLATSSIISHHYEDAVKVCRQLLDGGLLPALEVPRVERKLQAAIDAEVAA